jgi:hypothetical protein
MPDPKIVIAHSVADVEQWLGFKAERAEAIGGLGGTNVVDQVFGNPRSTGKWSVVECW